MKFSAKQIRRLRKVKQAILDNYTLYCQANGYKIEMMNNYCGTAACIMGWAEYLFRKRFTPAQKGKATKINNKQFPGNSENKNLSFGGACIALDLTPDQGTKLWSKMAWPTELIECYTAANGRRSIIAKIAARRIEMFIRSNGLE